MDSCYGKAKFVQKSTNAYLQSLACRVHKNSNRCCILI